MSIKAHKDVLSVLELLGRTIRPTRTSRQTWFGLDTTLKCEQVLLSVNVSRVSAHFECCMCNMYRQSWMELNSREFVNRSEGNDSHGNLISHLSQPSDSSVYTKNGYVSGFAVNMKSGLRVSNGSKFGKFVLSQFRGPQMTSHAWADLSPTVMYHCIVPRRRGLTRAM